MMDWSSVTAHHVDQMFTTNMVYVLLCYIYHEMIWKNQMKSITKKTTLVY